MLSIIILSITEFTRVWVRLIAQPKQKIDEIKRLLIVPLKDDFESLLD